ncbi:helix-turn-helix domain containing protein [Lactiplantibacillus plantarum]|nr:helix-turn-helix domain-containing protein [Lactiplantibacillus plantarum]UNB87521.1 helix-turn-helix domain containing protein [Lactiplantibacillus plantarum]
MGQKGSRYSLEEKLFYIGLVRDGVSATSIHREYGVHHSQVAQWIMRYDAGGPEALSWSSISTRVLRSAYA